VVSPLVTVVISTRNREDLLPRAVESVAAQTLTDFECVIVDDGSSVRAREANERTVSAVGARFRLHCVLPPDSPGTGPGSTRNRGLRDGRGRYLTFLDDDDWWIARDHLEVAVDVLERFKADYFFSNRQGLRGGKILIPDWYTCCPGLTTGSKLRAAPAVFEVSTGQLCTLMKHTYINPGNLVTRLDLALATGGFVERMFYGEDYEFGLRLADVASRILYRPDVTTAARLPEGDSVSLAQSSLQHQLSMIGATQHVRARCRRPEIRACARAREAWTLRELAQNPTAKALGYRLSLAWQALCLYPTPGALRFLLQRLGEALVRSESNS
jgi:glycosyltransferase involved in cell wall biosynthesis